MSSRIFSNWKLTVIVVGALGGCMVRKDHDTGTLGCDYFPNITFSGMVTYEDETPVVTGTVQIKEEGGPTEESSISDGYYEMAFTEWDSESYTFRLSATDENCKTSTDTVQDAVQCSQLELNLILDDCPG